MSLRRETEWPGLVAVVASALLFGTLAIFGTYAQRQHLTIVTLLGLRFLIAAVALWAVVVVRRQLCWPAVHRAAQLGALGLRCFESPREYGNGSQRTSTNVNLRD